MRVLVPIKRVIDYNVVVQIQPNGKDVVTDNVKMSINPFDEIALEEAIKLSEQGHVSEVVIVSIGQEVVEEQLRQGLAMGADRAILIPCENSLANDPLSVAKILKAVVQKENSDFVLMGKQAIDNDCNQTGQMLAGLLDWSQMTFASEVCYEKDSFIVSREIDGGQETLSAPLPAVITVDLRLNQPRYISLPNIMMAKQKKLDRITLDEMKLKLKPQYSCIGLELPKSRSAGLIFTDVDDFIRKLDEDSVWG